MNAAAGDRSARSALSHPLFDTSTQGRDELNMLLEFLRDGDKLVVTRVDQPLCNGLTGHTLRYLRMYCPKPRGGKNPLSDVEYYMYVREWCVTEPI